MSPAATLGKASQLGARGALAQDEGVQRDDEQEGRVFVLRQRDGRDQHREQTHNGRQAPRIVRQRHACHCAKP